LDPLPLRAGRGNFSVTRVYSPDGQASGRRAVAVPSPFRKGRGPRGEGPGSTASRKPREYSKNTPQAGSSGAGLGVGPWCFFLRFALCFWNFATQAAAANTRSSLSRRRPDRLLQTRSLPSASSIRGRQRVGGRPWNRVPCRDQRRKFTVEIATKPTGRGLIWCASSNEQGASGPRFLIVHWRGAGPGAGTER